MVFAVLLVCAVVLAWPIACGTSPRPRRTHSRDARLRFVERHPEQVNTGDIRRLLGREMSASAAAGVCDRAQAAGISAWTMLAWTQRFGGRGLADAVAAGLRHEELLLHLGNGTAPDLGPFDLVAERRARPAGPALQRRVAPTATSTTVAPTASAASPAPSWPAAEDVPNLPQIFEPGWPFAAAEAELPSCPDFPDFLPPIDPGAPGGMAA